MGLLRGTLQWSNITKGIKTTPIRFFGLTAYLNAGGKTMAKRADKANGKAMEKGMDNLFAQISNDAKLGLYYGIYTVRIENLDEALLKLRRKDYLIVQLGADTDYVYLALYWGHWTGLDNPRLFARYFASFVSETALYAGKKGIYADKRSINKFIRQFIKRVQTVGKQEFMKNKEFYGKNNPEGKMLSHTCRSLVLQTVTRFVILLKGGQPLYIPDQACCDGIIKLTGGSDENESQAIRALANLAKVLQAMGLWDFFAKNYKRYSKGKRLYDECLEAARIIDQDYADSEKKALNNEFLQMCSELKYLPPDLAKLQAQAVKQRYKL